VQVYISEKWRFIYVRQPKSSSTAIIAAIKTQLCGLEDRKADCEPDEFRLADSRDISDHVWEEFFVFTFVRNPWTRMLSAYRMFQERLLRRCELCTRSRSSVYSLLTSRLAVSLSCASDHEVQGTQLLAVLGLSLGLEHESPSTLQNPSPDMLSLLLFDNTIQFSHL
jgi:hypothetical protein